MVEDARKSSQLQLSNYVDLIENARDTILPPVEYAENQLVEKLIQVQFINNADVSARQIPVWFRFRESLPLTVNSKINYNALANEPLDGSEVAVLIEETNISVDRITVK